MWESEVSEVCSDNLAPNGKCWRHETEAAENCQVGDESPKFSRSTG